MTRLLGQPSKDWKISLDTTLYDSLKLRSDSIIRFGSFFDCVRRVSPFSCLPLPHLNAGEMSVGSFMAALNSKNNDPAIFIQYGVDNSPRAYSNSMQVVL